MPDTSTTAVQVQVRALRALPAAGRLEIAVEMSLVARALAAARLKVEHPQWREAEVRQALLRLMHDGTGLPPRVG
ncbi:MAG TPA: hypothetical protein VLT17_05570 [Gemmatimonadales bacterium]|jgi:hypothetical protein|nr:hypothetical protein [Gemmatimonadales bacterium]